MKIFLIIMILFSIGFAGARYAFAAPMRRFFDARMYFSFAAILGAGFVLHNAMLFISVAALVLLLTVRNRIDALCRLAMLVALIPDVSYSLSAGTIYLVNLTTSDALSFGALLACLFRPGSRRHRGISAEDTLVIVLMFIFGVAASRSANFTGISREFITILLGLGLPFFVFSRFVHNRSEFRLVVGAIAGTALILAIVALYEAKFHWSTYYTVFVNQSPTNVMSHSLRLRAGLMRTPTSFHESTSYAVFALIGVFAVVASRHLFRDSILWSASIGLAVLGLLVAQSRGADLALLLGLFILLVVRRRYALAVAVAAGGGAIVGALFFLASSMPKVAAFLGADQGFGSDGDYRQTLLRRGIEEGMKHPIIGDDLTKALSRMSDMVQGEGIIDLVNTYLVIFLDSGFVGLALVCALLMTIAWKIQRSPTSAKKDGSFISLQMFLASALGALLFALLFTSFYERNPYWLMMLLAGCRILVVPDGSVGQGIVRKLSESANTDRGGLERPTSDLQSHPA
jgi:O-antigen ligase